MPRATLPLTVNPALDVAAAAARFAIAGRVQIADFLSEASALALREELLAAGDWRRVIWGGSRVFEIAAGDFAAMTAAERRPIDAAVEREAAHGFQFRYEAIRVPDDTAARAALDSRLAEFAGLMSSDAVLDPLKAITGQPALDFADAQATLFRPGDFLTRHDDDVAGKNRMLAYVLGLAPGWAAEWGGLLLFNDEAGGVVETIVPRFNALSLFTVPQPHSVGCVAPFAPDPRLSITGWIRRR